MAALAKGVELATGKTVNRTVGNSEWRLAGRGEWPRPCWLVLIGSSHYITPWHMIDTCHHTPNSLRVKLESEVTNWFIQKSHFINLLSCLHM